MGTATPMPIGLTSGTLNRNMGRGVSPKMIAGSGKVYIMHPDPANFPLKKNRQ